MLWSRIKEAWKYQWGWVLIAAVVGLALGMVPHSSYSYDAGRYGGYWNILHKLPVLVDRSPVFIMGSVFGALSLVVWLNLCTKRDRLIWVGTLIAFTMAQSANHSSWQRYHEPMLLIMVLIIMARSVLIERFTRQIVVGSVILGITLGGITIGSMWSAGPVEIQAQLVE